MREKIASLFNISPEDLTKLFYLVTLFLFITTGDILGVIATNSLFVVKFGVEKLPLMFMISAVVSICFSIWFFTVSKQIPRSKLFLTLFSSFAVVIFLCRILIDIEFIEKSIYFYPFLFIVTAIISMTLPILFWSAGDDICNSREAKRLFPLVMVGGQIGAITACFSVKYIVNTIGAKNIYILWSSFIILAILAFGRIYTKFRNLFLSASVVEHKTMISFSALRHNFTAVVMRNPFIKFLAFSAILMVVLDKSIDFNFYAIVKSRFQDVNKFAVINGLTYGVGNILIFFLQLFVTGRLIMWVGIGIMLLIFPLGMLVNFTVLLSYTLASAIFARINTTVLKQSVQKPVSAIIYNPIERNKRIQTITFIEGFIHPLGDFTAGMMIYILQIFPVKTTLLVVSMGLSIVWFFSNLRLKEKYIQMVLSSLKGADYDARFEAIKVIQNIKDSRINKGLIGALADPNPVIRSNAALVLGKTKDKDIVSALINVAKEDENKYVRAAAVQSLGEIGDITAIEPLIEILKKEYSERVRATIISVLKGHHDEKLVNILLEFLNDEDARVRANTVEVLRDLGNKDIKQKLIPLLDDPNNRVKANAIVTLYPWMDQDEKKNIFDKIINMAKSGIPEERASAYFAMGSIKNTNFIEYLVRGVEDENSIVRRQIAFAFGYFETVSIIDPLIKLLGDSEYQVRNVAADVILNNKNIFFERLLNALSIAIPLQKIQIIELLGHFRDKKAIGPLEELLKDPDDKVRLKTIVSLGELKSDNIDLFVPLLKDGSNLVRSAAVRLVGKLDPVKLKLYVVEMLNDKDPRVRSNAIEVISDVSCGNVIDVCRQYLKDEHYRVRAAAAITLWKNNNSDGIPMLKKMLEDENKWVRATAIYGFGEIGSIKFVEDLLKVLEEKDLDIKRQAAAALEKIGGPAIEALEKLLYKKKDVSEKENRDILFNSVKAIIETGGSAAKSAIVNILIKSDFPEIDDNLKIIYQGEDKILNEKLVEALGKFKYENLLILSLKGINFTDLNSQLAISMVVSNRDIMLKNEKDAAIQCAEMVIDSIRNCERYEKVLNSLGKYKSFSSVIKELERIINISIQMIINILKGLGDRKEIEVINKKLADPDERIRANALGALESIGDKHIIKLFMPILEKRIMHKKELEEKEYAGIDIYEGIKILWQIFNISDARTKTITISAITEILQSLYKDCVDRIYTVSDPQLKIELLRITDNLKEFVNAKQPMG